MLRRILLIALAGVAVFGAMAFGFKGDPHAALKSITDFRTKELADARAAGKTVDFAALTAKVKKMATDVVSGVDSMMVEPKDGLAYAQLFQLAEMPKDACMAAEAFLKSNPDAAQKYQAQNIMLTSCNDQGEGMRVMELIKSMNPPTPASLYGMASMTAYYYADTIKDSVGLEAALATLKLMEANVKASAATTDAEKRSQRSALVTLGQSKAEMLNDSGKKADAIASIDDLLASLGANAPEARTLNGLKTRINLINAGAPALTYEKSYGKFDGLESLKGKVVILDFFAHWCGPCIASFPDMKKLYADFQSKGLEVVGFTTYYGYYKRENTEKRDMAKDVEYGKMGEFIKEYSLPWPVVYGERTNFDAYGVTGIPHVAVIGRDGKVHKIKVGYSAKTFADFRKEIEKLLNE